MPVVPILLNLSTNAECVQKAKAPKNFSFFRRHFVLLISFLYFDQVLSVVNYFFQYQIYIKI